MTFLCPGLPVKAIRTAATRYCGKTVTASSADGGAWAMTATGAPCWSFCLWLRTLSLKPRSASPRIRMKDALDGLLGCTAAGASGFPLLNGAIEIVDQISTNRHGGRLWVSANEPRDVVFQFTFPAAQERTHEINYAE